MMKPKEILLKWIEYFNKYDVEGISSLYSEDAVNHQIPNNAAEGKTAIKNMFESEFANADMVCIPENIFEDGQWTILEWKDPNGLRGCGFFKIQKDKIIFQRGYWDKLSCLKLQNRDK